MIQNEYLIQDLEKETGLDRRTIRYYQEKGLIPWPENRKRYAIYNDDHILRLKLILILKKTYLPLDEIKKQINALNYEQVKNLVESSQDKEQKKVIHRDAFIDKMVEPSSETALDYITNVLHTKPEHKLELSQSRQVHYPKQSEIYMSGTPIERLQRILLIPGIEIQFSDSLSPADKKRLEELIRLAKDIFT